MVNLTSSKCVLAAGAVAGAAVLSAFVKSARSRHRKVSSLARHNSRRVEVLVRGQQLNSGPSEVSIASWNLLCEPFATPNRLPHCVPTFLTYEYRWPLMQKELESFGSDIIALQEVTVDRWSELEAFMKTLGYQGIVQKKEHNFLLALFFRTDKLALIWSEERSRAILAELQLRESMEDETTETHSPRNVGASIDTGGNSSDSGSENGTNNDDGAPPHTTNKKKKTNHNTKQAPSNPNSLVYVINAHLEGSPYRPSDRVAQIKHALQRLEHHMDVRGVSYEAAKLIICGDFNSLPNDSPGVFLREGYLEAEHHDAFLPEVAVTGKSITHPFHLVDVYEAAHAVPPFTRKVNSEGCRMDFVYASCNTLTTKAVLRPLKEEHKEIVLRDYLPNKVHPSDHLPVGCILKCNNKEITR